ncbi:MAG TPA: WD40 repeat domain-containing protein [Gemmataceae bacterium]|nr:WD40 repeat domain-containing protein [Gemmataceae bacterium]
MRRLPAVLPLLLLASPATSQSPDMHEGTVRYLLTRLGSDRFRQTNRVEAISYSPDGKQLVTADGECVHIWDAADGRRLHTTPLEGRKIIAIRYGREGRELLVAVYGEGYKSHLLRIDPASGKVLDDVPFPAPNNKDGLFPEPKALFSPDGNWLALCDEFGRRLTVTDTGTGKSTVCILPEDSRVWSLAFRGDGRMLAACVDGWVRLSDPKSGEVLHEFPIEDGVVWNMAFSPDGKDLVAEISSPSPNRVVKFDTATGKVNWTYTTERAKELSFTGDGKAVRYYGTAGHRNDPVFWRWLDAATGKPLSQTMNAEYGHEVAICPDGKVLAIGGFHGHISQWDLDTRRRLDDSSADPPEPVTDLRFTADGTKVRGWARGWYEWDVKSGKQTRLTPRVDRSEESRWLAVSHDQKWLAKIVRLDDERRRVELTDLTTGRLREAGLAPRNYAWLSFLPDGRLLLVDDDGLTAIEPRTAKSVRIDGDTTDETIVAADDGSVAVVLTKAGDGLKAVRWDLTTGRRAGEWTGRRDEPPRIGRSLRWRGQMSPDRGLLAVSSLHPQAPDFSEYHTSVFDAHTGRYRSGWQNIHSSPDVTFSPDGRSVVCHYGSILGVEVRDVATGQLRRRFPGAPMISGCAFSPDGRTLAVALSPGPVELWDLVGDRVGHIGKWDWEPRPTWDELADANDEMASHVIGKLRANPAKSVPLLKNHMTTSAAKDPAWVAARIKALDAPAFRDREKATAELAAEGELVTSALREALPKASAEASERLTGLLAKADVLTPDKLRTIRACEVLEGIATPEARELLARWARGPAGASLTREAAESLERLKRR